LVSCVERAYAPKDWPVLARLPWREAVAGEAPDRVCLVAQHARLDHEIAVHEPRGRLRWRSRMPVPAHWMEDGGVAEMATLDHSAGGRRLACASVPWGAWM
jgi:hypothetical protein